MLVLVVVLVVVFVLKCCGLRFAVCEMRFSVSGKCPAGLLPTGCRYPDGWGGPGPNILIDI